MTVRTSWQRFLLLACCAALCAGSLTFLSPAHVSAELIVGGNAVVITSEGDSLTVRSGPGRQNPSVGALPEGTVVALIGGPATSDDGIVWFQIRGRGVTGWASAEWLGEPGKVAASASAAPSPTPAQAPAPAATPVPAATPAPAQPSGDGPKITGTGGAGARLRATPSLRAAIVLVIPDGATVEVTGAAQTAEGYQWTPVRYSGQTGWVASSLLSAFANSPAAAPAPTPASSPSPAPAPAPSPAPSATPAPAAAGTALNPGERGQVVGTEGLPLRIRQQPGLNAPVVTTIPAGAIVLVTTAAQADATGELWSGIEYQGTKGWVLSEHLARTEAPLNAPPATSTPAPTPVSTPVPTPRTAATATPTAVAAVPANGDRGQAVAQTALRFLGVPYVYGGATPSGWDCSGFVLYVYNLAAKIDLPRSAASQYKAGAVIPADQVRAGDIVFFSDTFGPGITHDGIALGDGTFIHARSEAYGTVISSLSDPYWSSHYAGARRP